MPVSQVVFWEISGWIYEAIKKVKMLRTIHLIVDKKREK